MSKTFYLLISSIIVIGCVSNKKEITQENNFSFAISYKPCGSSFYDSSIDKLIHTNVDGSGPFTVTLELTKDELNQIFNKAIETDFFSLPNILTAPENSNLAYQAPSLIKELSVTNGEITHTVFWDDEIITVPLYKEAEQFNELFWLIFEIIWSHPEYQEIPEDTAGCA